jgi:hypothetical protein
VESGAHGRTGRRREIEETGKIGRDVRVEVVVERVVGVGRP